MKIGKSYKRIINDGSTIVWNVCSYGADKYMRLDGVGISILGRGLSNIIFDNLFVIKSFNIYENR